MTGSLEERIARIEADLAIRNLAIRYAHAVDGRDIESLIALFVDHDRARERYGRALRTAYRTVHSVSNHLIELTDPTSARGRVYTRAEEERKDSWAVRAMMYFDDYACVDGEWRFVDRATHYWYLTEFDRKPHAPGFMDPADTRGRTADLPHTFTTWQPYWDEAGPDAAAAVTHEP
jgi:hypothetical protein